MKKSKFEFSTPKLEKVKYENNIYFDKSCFTGITVEAQTEVKRHENKNEATVTLGLNIGEKENSLPFLVEISMSTNIRWEEEFNEELIVTILSSNAPSLILSYIRPIVANLTGNSGLPAYNIPFMDFTSNNDEVIKKEELD